jgi:hypothetical protein
MGTWSGVSPTSAQEAGRHRARRSAGVGQSVREFLRGRLGIIGRYLAHV